MVRRENGRFDDDFIQIVLGREAQIKAFLEELSLDDVQKIILDAFKAISIDAKIDEDVREEQVEVSLSMAYILGAIREDLRKKPVLREVFETNPAAYVAIKGLEYAASQMRKLKLSENYWNPKLRPYTPLIGSRQREDSWTTNAFICGVYNGIIEFLAGIADAVAFFFTLATSPTKMKEFIDAIKKLWNEENIIEVLFQAVIEDYKDIENPVQLSYQIGYDLIIIVDILLSIIQIGKSVVTFANMLKKSFRFIKKYGRKGIDDIKKLRGNNKKLNEVFDQLDEADLASKIRGYSSRFARRVRRSLDDAPEIVTDFERLHRNSDVEFGQLHNRSSRNTDITTSNLQNKIIWPDRLLRKIRNTIVTHNHPLGTGLSVPDIKFFITHRLQEIRAVAPNGDVFSIKWKGKLPSKKEYGNILQKLEDIELEFAMARAFSVGDLSVSIKREFEAVFKFLEDKIDYIHYVN